MEELFCENPEDVASRVYGPYHGLDDHVPQRETIESAATNVDSKVNGPEDRAKQLHEKKIRFLPLI